MGCTFTNIYSRAARTSFMIPQGYGKLSQTALHYIGGLLFHGPAVLAFTSPFNQLLPASGPGF